MKNIEELIHNEMTHQEVIQLFNNINKAECYLHTLKKKNNKDYKRLKVEAGLLEDSDTDKLIYDCTFVEEPKLVRHVINCLDVSNIDSSFDHGLRKIEGLEIKYWRDFLKGSAKVDPEDYLLYLNYFTLFSGRTGGEANIEVLENLDYLKDQFIREKKLAKLLTFDHKNINTIHSIKITRTGDLDRIILEKSNKALEDQINTLLRGEKNA